MADAPAATARTSGGTFGFLSHKVFGKVPVWVIAVAAVGAWYWYTHYGPGKPAAAGTQTDPAGNTGIIDQATGFVYGSPEDLAALQSAGATGGSDLTGAQGPAGPAGAAGAAGKPGPAGLSAFPNPTLAQRKRAYAPGRAKNEVGKIYVNGQWYTIGPPPPAAKPPPKTRTTPRVRPPRRGAATAPVHVTSAYAPTSAGNVNAAG